MTKDYGPAPVTKEQIASMAFKKITESVNMPGVELSITFIEEDGSLKTFTHPKEVQP